MGRVRMLRHFGITPYLVFDGDSLPGKAGTNNERRVRRKESKSAGLELLKLGKTAQAHQELQKSVDITSEMVWMIIEELKDANIDYMVAPYEADSQLVYLERVGIIHGILSEDSDLLVFGAKCLITKLDQYGECVMIHRDDFTACREISLVGWSDAEFRRMAILSGCDYLASIAKMGLKTAHRLIRKHKTVERIIRAVQFDGQYKVPPDYLDAFNQAEMTFLYQWVFCPLSNRLVNFTEPPPSIDPKELPYIGAYVEPGIAAAVACGDLHPSTKQAVTPRSQTRGLHRSLTSARKQVAAGTPDLKKTRSIDSFFRPKRTPLAELDPNSFTPSPSQQRLLHQASGATWSASPAPPRPHLNRARTSLSASLSQVSRREVSDSFARNGPAPHPSKRQRLCSDDAFDLPTGASIQVEFGSSRFFMSTSKLESPSTGTGGTSGKAAKADVHPWSDDSIEDAMAELPDPDDSALPKKKSKVEVYTDEAPSLSSCISKWMFQDRDGSQPTSQSTTLTSSTSQASQEPAGIITPASSFGGSQADDAPPAPSIFAAHLTAQTKTFRARFSHQPPPSTAPAGARAAPEPNRRPSDAASRTRSAPAAATAGPAPAPPAEPPPRTASPAPKSQMPAAPVAAAAATTDDDGAADAELPPRPEIEDAAWQAAGAEAVVAVPGSDADHAAEQHKRVGRREALLAWARGSEDFLVEDSEGGEGESDEEGGVEGRAGRAWDLGRFAFVGR